jgi:hypothetical protein
LTGMFDWEKLDPEDGWSAEFDLTDAEASLYLLLRVKGKIERKLKFDSISCPNTRELGELKRKLILVEAVAEYLNAGGCLTSFVADLAGIPNEHLVMDGWHYLDGGLSLPEGNRVHEFVDDSGLKYVRWVRNEFIDTNLTVKEINHDHLELSSGSPDFN